MATKTYNTRRRRKLDESEPKSRVDWKRTKKNMISQILDSDESFTSEEEELEETEEESDASTCTDEEDQPEETTQEDGEERIRKPKLKSKSAILNSESSSDSDGPGERVHVRRKRAIKDDDSDDAKESEDEQTKAHVKKQKRMELLNKLAERRRSRGRTTSHEATEENTGDETPETHRKSEDSDNMSDFIVEDDEENNNDGEAKKLIPSYKELFRKHHISMTESYDLSSHLQKVIKALLINIVDNTFLTSLYKGERKKRYAKDMLKSLNCLDDRIIGPRLEKLTSSCRWTKRYKERINSYPDLHVKHISAEMMACGACELQRWCGYRLVLSGQAYDNKTLEHDNFLLDDKQKLVVGAVCASRTEAYHQLRHYKYFLCQRCAPFIETKEGSANEIVESALSEMEAEDFLEKEVQFLEGYLNEADYFQDESKDSLLS